MPSITAKRVLYRLKRAENEGLRDYKDKVYRLRRIVSGDRQALTDNSPGNSLDSGQQMQRPDTTLRPDVLVQDYMEGQSNALLNLLGALMLKTTLNFPDIAMEGVTAKEQAVNSQYLKAKLGPRIKGGVNWVPQTRIAVMDYLMGGLGCVYLPVDDGDSPGWRWADTLHLVWDQGARTPDEVLWMGLSVVKPLWYWRETFPNAGALIGQGSGDPDHLEDDRNTELMFYYDVEGEGHQYIFLKKGEGEYDDDPVHEGPNPHTADVSGKPMPFLPFSSVFWMSLPSVRLPIGVAEKMLPSQIAVWKSVQMISDIIDRGSAFYEADEDGFGDEKAKNKFIKAVQAGIVWVKGGIGKIKVNAPLAIPESVGEELQRNLRDINEQVGMSNAVTGQRTPSSPGGKMTATEYKAIQGQSELTAAAVMTDVTRLMEESLAKFLWNAKRYDTRPFSCRIDKVVVKFGKKEPLGPVKDYLRPDAWIVVSGESMTHIPRQQRVQQAQMNLEVALKLAQVVPQAAILAYKDFLEAQGVENVEAYLQQPPNGQQLPGLGGTPANTGGAAAIQSSTGG